MLADPQADSATRRRNSPSGADIQKDLASPANRDASLWTQYIWGERSSVEEQLVTKFPARWLPQGYAKWEDFLAAVVDRGLKDANAPSDLATWQQGKAPRSISSTRSSPARRCSAASSEFRQGPGPSAQSGGSTTVRNVGPAFGPSERFTADLSDPDRTTLNVVLGQSGNVSSPWYMDQFPDWLRGTTYPLPFTPAAVQATTTHTLVLTPR